MKRDFPLACFHARLGAGLAASLILTAPAQAAQTIPDTPLATNRTVAPLTMLTVGRDHTLFYEAYNDASDIDGDDVLDAHFKPSITYYGLFDPTLCYSHSGGSGAGDLFKPVGPADPDKGCSSSAGRWHGNWLNYATTSRIDALRKVLYGGYRDVDAEAETVLRRAYIPQDAHSWAKEYASETNDGYLIGEYTPLSQPRPGKRHFFGNLTETNEVQCATLDDCSNRPPLLRVVENSSKRVWEWASWERPVLRKTQDGGGGHGGSRRNDYTVRVAVCEPGFTAGCKLYPSGHYKPVGLLHDYGENEAMYFGLLTGSYNKSMSGGVLRKVVSSFKTEVDPQTGRWSSNPTIVSTLDRLRIRDFNNYTLKLDPGNYDANRYRGGWTLDRRMNEGEFVDWGNPVGEMMYEVLRYFAGAKSATSAFHTSGAYDAQIGLPVASWDDPYATDSAGKGLWCARPNMLIVSGINPSYDSDQLPGSAFASGSLSGGLGAGTLDVAKVGKTIADGESGVMGKRFIGQVGNEKDSAPTAKAVTSLGNIRGLAPEDPTKEGSYYSASVAHFGKTTDLRTTLANRQTVDTFAVVLNSPLPRIEAKTTSGRTITLVPFAKTIGSSGCFSGKQGNWDLSTKGRFQPTDQIVDFYVDTIANSGTADSDPSRNEGRYYAKFRINFEDVEQGADHDMDVIVTYEVEAQPGGGLKVKLTPEYRATCIYQSIGYVISGTTDDGAYLVVQGGDYDMSYYLHVPPGRSPGYCDSITPPSDCEKLPYTGGAPAFSERIFTPGSSAAAFLKDPLWFAAKWGGFVDRNGNDTPDLTSEWDSNRDGVPDTYFLVQNPTKLRDALKNSFDNIASRAATTGNLTSNGQQLRTESKIFVTKFDSRTWSGELAAYQVSASGVASNSTWKASEQLPPASSRRIFTWLGGAGTKGVAFNWSNLPPAQQTALGTEQVLNFLRGDRSSEIQRGGTLRDRASVLGDFAHSAPYYVKELDTVFAGANDGMLHAFSASTGRELYAYLPGLVFSKLARLASPDYVHTFFVDGSVVVSTQAQAGRNILVGAAGRGAKGLYALDVTPPDSFSASDVLWEYDGTSDADMGYILGPPQIAKLENDAIVLVVGNGYNSSNGKAVLYVMALDTGDLIAKIDTAVTGDNGLSTPTLVDTNGNGKIDTAYAGDLKGNLWRFDLGAQRANQWKSAYQSGGKPQPLFTAKGPNGSLQPISAPVTVAKNTVTSDPNYGKTFVFFGTGSYVFSTDPASKDVQSWYGIIDTGEAIGGRSDLVARTIEVTSGQVRKYDARAFSTATVADMTDKKGWFVDLKDPSARGERIVTRPRIDQFLEPVLYVSSIIPETETDPCDPSGTGHLNLVSPFNGGRLKYPALDLNKDGKFDSADKIDGAVIVTSVRFDGLPGEAIRVGDRLVVGIQGAGGSSGTSGGGEDGGGAGGGGDGGDGDGGDGGDGGDRGGGGGGDGGDGGGGGGTEDFGTPTGGKRLGRISWREIVRD